LHTGWEDADALSEEEGENFLEFKVGEGIPAIKVRLSIVLNKLIMLKNYKKCPRFF
jgi:hypothetical protein